jgi:DNA processing protein
MSLLDAVALNIFDSIGPLDVRRLLERFGTPTSVLDERAGGKVKPAEVRAARERAKREIDRAEKEKVRILLETDGDYPRLLHEIPDPPLVLYARGDLGAEPGLAIVGARKADAYGLSVAQGFARSVSEMGVAVVSGLAYGVDAAAHRSALDARANKAASGPTIAVLGSGLLRLYPSEHAGLARRIVNEGGGLLSEFPLTASPRRWNFPRRNRLIAGMTHGTVIIQAGAKSGSLITARLASEYGRQVWVVPNRVGDPLSEGGHSLLRVGATAASAPADVLEDLEPVLGRQLRRVSPERGGARMHGPAAAQGGAEFDLLNAIGADGATRDEILERSSLSTEDLPRLLLKLELSGRITAIPGGLFRLTGH